MRNPQNVLNGLRKHASQENYVYDRIYRNLYNPEFFLQAYQNMYAKQGNMTPGTDGKTIDAMSMKRINSIIDSLKDESYQPKPSRRTYIPKKNGKMRPLGIPSVDDKLTQEVVRMILEAMYEESFANTSHGFRPNRSCHTALRHIQTAFSYCTWFVEGDIKGFFDNIDHNVMIAILRKRILDEKFLRLIRKFLKAGYMENFGHHATYSGTPQGGIISPILANIYLNQLDKFMDDYKADFDKGTKRTPTKGYQKISHHRSYLLRKMREAETAEVKSRYRNALKATDKEFFSTQSSEPMDANLRRIQYVRYADDFLIGIIGAKADATQVKMDIHDYLQSALRLELSEEKTFVSKASDKARFLGYDISIRKASNLTKKQTNGRYARVYSGKVALEIPVELVRKKLLELKAITTKQVDGSEVWKPIVRNGLVCKSDLEILDKYNSESRGFINYYSIANNSSSLHKFRHMLEYSMYKTFGDKYRTRKHQIIERYRIDKDFGVKYNNANGEERVRTFWKGSLSTKFSSFESGTDLVCKPKGLLKKKSLGARLNVGCCEWCGKTNQPVLVHQVRNMKELDKNKEWATVMLRMNRKTLVVCEDCHKFIHSVNQE